MPCSLCGEAGHNRRTCLRNIEAEIQRLEKERVEIDEQLKTLTAKRAHVLDKLAVSEPEPEEVLPTKRQ